MLHYTVQDVVVAIATESETLDFIVIFVVVASLLV